MTLAAYVQAYASDVIAEGWQSGRGWEPALQTRIDSLIRIHLSARIGAAALPGGALTYAQHGGNTALAVPTAPLDTGHWPILRENRYAYDNNKVSDFGFDATRHANIKGTAIVHTKSTGYWVELKVETRGTGDFGGGSLAAGFAYDWDKLAKQAVDDLLNWPPPGPVQHRKRYWFIAVAISHNGRQDIQAIQGIVPGTNYFEWQIQALTAGIGWLEFTI